MLIRPRRLRINPKVRHLVQEALVQPKNLIIPVFVAEGISTPREIKSMPGVFQHSLDSLARFAEECAEAGLGGIDVFGIPSRRDANGSEAWNDTGILNRGLQKVRDTVGDDLVIVADTCLDEFTDHGHCGVLDEKGRVLNDATVELYAKMALAQAAAGAHWVSPSGMMDGQVKHIREELDKSGFEDVAILAYSAKYASGFYGPFRDAVESKLSGDRRTYQLDPANSFEGLRESLLDVDEGADVVMVKPAGYYLDVLSQVKANVLVPVAAYQVSGEYAMIEAACANGWLDRKRVICESLTSIFRAGADLVLSYWALEYAKWFQEGSI